ncbi:MAG TPA: TIGR01459 family HAD-type hydrolase [Caulobacteraceae bacterium]|nr:TIGR01459 family HAD-type hydrolase [Caulobacteraceae bacterium]
MGERLPTRLVRGLSEIAPHYDAVFCDIVGVVHNGLEPFVEACEALRCFRAERGPVVLISNAPVASAHMEKQLLRLGVPADTHDAIVSSGDAARLEFKARAPGPAWRIGPSFDAPLYEGLGLEFTTGPDAAFIACVGLRNMPDDEPDAYRAELGELAGRGLEMICANPDTVYRRGERLIWCAGALAAIYEDLGGRVLRTGKPARRIYRLARSQLKPPVKRAAARVLVVGDGPATDMRGAMGEGMDSLFIGSGVHDLSDSEVFLARAVEVLEDHGVHCAYASPTLRW